MAKAIFTVFFKVIVALTNIVLAPVNLLIMNLFPDLSNLMTSFNHVISNYFGSGMAWFFTILPVNVRGFVVIYLTILISYYTISISVHAILKVYTIIKNIKIW